MRPSRTAVFVLAATLLAVGPEVVPLGREASAGAQPLGGPVVLVGIDAEDGGPGAHGPIANYVQLTDDVVSKVSNGNSGGILVIGGGKSASDNVTTFWNQVGSGTGAPITYVNGATNIAARSFSGFEVVAVVSSSFETASGGLTAAENSALTERATDVASFVNAGGGLIGFEQSQASSPFAYVGGLGDFTVATTSYSNIDPTPAGTAVGITNALDVCCWHQVFDSYPDFLDVLATTPIGGNNRVAALGGQVTTLTGDQPPVPDGQTIGACRHGSIAYEEHARSWVQCMADPVNTATGAFEEAVADASLPGIGTSFEFRRSYSSADTATGPLGLGWTHSYNMSLTFTLGEVPVAVGAYHSLAVDPDGSVWAWGSNGFGELGDPTVIETWEPVPIPGITDVTAVAAGWGYSLALRADGTVWAWGFFGPEGEIYVPTQVSGISDVVAIAAGGTAVALRSDGTVWDLGTSFSPVSQVPGLADVTAIAAGGSRNLALRTDGTAWSWADTSAPAQVVGLADVTAIAAGQNHSLALRSDGTAWAWGDNDSGQLGNGTTTSSPVPVPVTGLAGVTAIAAHSLRSVAIKSDGSVWAWGFNGSGGLGNGTTTHSSLPVEVAGLAGAAAIAPGSVSGHSLALAADGAPSAWGSNTYGQLGDGTNTNRTTPVQVVGLELGLPAGARASFRAEDGQQLGYSRESDGSFVPEPGVRSRLAAVGDGYELTRADQVAYSFAGSGLLTSLVDRNGQGLTFGYDVGGNLATIADEAGRVVSLGYDTSGHLITLTLPDLRQMTYGYTGDLLTTVTDLAGKVWTYGYDSAGRLDEIIDPNGNFEIRNTYDPITGRVTEQLDPLGNLSTFSWDPDTETATMTDAAGKTWTARYFANVLLRTTDPLGNTTQYEYDDQLNLAGVTDAAGNATVLEFDAHGNLLSRTAPEPFGYVESWSYDSDNNVTSHTDGRGNTTTYTYDAVGRLESETRPDADVPTGAVTSFTYDPVTGKVASITDPRNNTTTHTYDGFGNRTAVSMASGATTTFTHDAAGRIVSVVDPRGNEPGAEPNAFRTTYTYDNLGRLLTEVDPLGRETVFGYDNAGNRVSMTDADDQTTTYTHNEANELIAEADPLLRITSYGYDGRGLLISTTTPGGSVTTFDYDDAGRQVAMVEPRGNIAGADPADYRWVYGYDAAGNQTTVADPLGNTTTRTYDELNRVATITDPRGPGHTTTFGYDANGNRISETNPLSQTANFGYDQVNRIVTETNPRGKTTSYDYDLAGNRISMTTPEGNVTTSEYDDDNRLAAMVEPRGNAAGANPADFRWTYGYDVTGNRLTETSPLGHTLTLTYDPVGNLASETDARGGTVSYAYDALDRLLTVTAPDTTQTTYSYDAAGRLDTRTDAHNRVTTYAYDPDDRLIEVISPLGQRWTYTYDPAGNRATLTDAAANAAGNPALGQTSYSYDEAGRRVGIDYSDATPDVTLGYDEAGNRTLMTDGSGSVTSIYDAAGRLTSYTRGSDTVSFAYTPSGKLESRTYPGDTSTSFTYDDDDRMASTVTGANTVSYDYDPAGQLVATELPNGYTEARSYDRDGRLERVTHVNLISTLADFVYTRDPVGNATVVDATTGIQTYTYDNLSRLTGVCHSASCAPTSNDLTTWTYDEVGNRTSQTTGTATTTYTYNEADHLTLITSGQGQTTLTYDPNGNLIDDGTRGYTYGLDRRTRTVSVGGTTSTYSYDGDGNRLRASTGASPGETTSFLWDTNQAVPQVALERDGAGALLGTYLYGLDRTAMVRSGSTYYFHHDGLGSVANVTDATGSTRWTYGYEPFGGERTAQASGAAVSNVMRFAGEQLDPTGLYHLRARQYDPDTGRFGTTDPLPPGMRDAYVAAYVYADNDPADKVDPLGLRAGDAAVPIQGGRSMLIRYLERLGSSLTAPKSVGICGSVLFSYGFSAGRDRCLLDDGGALSWLDVKAAGVGTPTASIAAGFLLSNGQHADDLGGSAVCLGGGTSVPLPPLFLVSVGPSAEICLSTRATLIPLHETDLTGVVTVFVGAGAGPRPGPEGHLLTAHTGVSEWLDYPQCWSEDSAPRVISWPIDFQSLSGSRLIETFNDCGTNIAEEVGQYGAEISEALNRAREFLFG